MRCGKIVGHHTDPSNASPSDGVHFADGGLPWLRRRHCNTATTADTYQKGCSFAPGRFVICICILGEHLTRKRKRATKKQSNPHILVLSYHEEHSAHRPDRGGNSRVIIAVCCSSTCQPPCLSNPLALRGDDLDQHQQVDKESLRLTFGPVWIARAHVVRPRIARRPATGTPTHRQFPPTLSPTSREGNARTRNRSWTHGTHARPHARLPALARRPSRAHPYPNGSLPVTHRCRVWSHRCLTPDLPVPISPVGRGWAHALPRPHYITRVVRWGPETPCPSTTG